MQTARRPSRLASMVPAPGPLRSRPRRSDDPWLPLGAASRLVGVGPDTLRRWADTGKVQSYQTPGGHRRFLRSSLEAMINAPRRARYGVERLPDSTPDDGRRAPSAHAARPATPASPGRRGSAPSSATSSGAGASARSTLVIEYVAASKKAERQLLLEEAEKMGALYGAEASRAGLTLAETVEAFLFFRSPVLDAIVGQLRRRSADVVGRHRGLPRGERGDRQRAVGPRQLAPRVRRRLVDDVQLGRGRVEALAAGIGADHDVLDARAPRVADVDPRLDAEGVARRPAARGFEATMYGSSCVSMPMPWPVRWRNASP